jgi:hypothetical protein
MSGKVVLIDEADSVGDVHESVVGKLNEYPMQANWDGLFGDRDIRMSFIYKSERARRISVPSVGRYYFQVARN